MPSEATDVADRALAEANVSTSELGAWKQAILDSQSGEKQLSQSELEGHADIEVVRVHVRSELHRAGYPVAPTRIIEVYADLECQ